MTTALNIIEQALGDIGVRAEGQDPSAYDYAISFDTLNQMIGEWNRKRWMIYQLVDYSFTSTGAQSYTVGPGGNFNITKRPDKIESAFARLLIFTPAQQVDYPLGIITARENYNQITLKSLASFPDVVFYDPGFPTGTLYVWPLPQSGVFSIHITVKATLATFVNQASTVTLPKEYEAALRYNLAERLMSGTFDVPDRPGVRKLAANAMNTVRGANAAIAVLSNPGLSRQGGSYNIYADRDY